MGLKDWPTTAFPGVAMNPRTLLLEVVDEEACAAALEASVDAADHVFVLLARGLNNEAAEVAAEARLLDPESLTLQILDAEVLRATKHYDRAEVVLRSLLPAVQGSALEALAIHDLGKVQFSKGNYDAAAKTFSAALAHRVANGAGAADIYASTVALNRALDLAESS